MLTLGIETATDVCAVALLEDERVRVEAAIHVPRSHAARLAPLVAEALAHAGRTPADLGLVAVSAGPGSYTGLRIGASTAKGLCLATGAALAGVPTLDALAAALWDGHADAPSPEEAVIAALPSRRGEVYAAAYAGDPTRAPLLEAAALPLDALAAWVPRRPLVLVGGAAGAVARALGPEPDTRVLPVTPSAVRVARLGRERFERDGGDDVAAFEPAYLKPFVVAQAGGTLSTSRP